MLSTALLYIVVGLLVSPTHCQDCQFQVHVLWLNENKTFQHVGHKIFFPGCTKTSTEIKCNNYFLNITVGCENAKDSLSFTRAQLTHGFAPHVTVFERWWDGEIITHYIDPVLVEDEHPNCYPFGSDYVYVSGDSYIPCDIAWMTKLPALCSTTRHVDIIVKSNNVGDSVANRRVRIHSNTVFVTLGYHRSIVAPSPETELHCLHCYELHKSSLGAWFIILLNGYILSSQMELVDVQFHKIDIDNLQQRCPADSPTINDVLIMKTFTLVASRNGVLAFNQNRTMEVVHFQCIRFLVLINGETESPIVISVDGTTRLYWSTTEHLENLTEIVNEQQQTMNEWLNTQIDTNKKINVEIFDVENGFLRDEILLLLRTTTIEIDHATSILRPLYDHDHDHATMNRNYVIKLKVTSDFSWVMTIVSDHNDFAEDEDLEHLTTSKFFEMFVWGSALYCSINGGVTFLELSVGVHGPLNEHIVSLTVGGEQGRFVFQTEDNKLYAGVCGYRMTKKLTMSPSANVLFHFFSSDGKLYQASLENDAVDDSKSSLKTKQLDFHTILEKTLYDNALENAIMGDLTLNCGYRESCNTKYEYYVYPDTKRCPFTFIGGFTATRRHSRELSLLHINSNSLVYLKWKLSLEYLKANTFGIWRTTSNTSSLVFDILKWQIKPPTKIALGFKDCFHMNVTVALIKKNDEEMSQNDQWELKYILLKHDVTNDDVTVTHERIIDYFNRVVILMVRICDAGTSSFYTIGVRFAIMPQPIECIYETNFPLNFGMEVKLGCPARRYVTVDLIRSKSKQKHFCKEDNCFYFDKAFNLVFILIDNATQQSEVFQGSANVTIIGGGPTPEDVRMYSNAEQFQYNQKGGTALIWARSGGVYSWLCRRSSPCGGVAPVFPKTSEYYFRLKFQNNYTQSNCDFSFTFVIKLHGMPPDGLYPSLFVVMLFLGLIAGVVFGAFLMQRHSYSIKSRVHTYRENCWMCWLALRRSWHNRVDASDSEMRINMKVFDWMEMNRKYLHQDKEEEGECSKMVDSTTDIITTDLMFKKPTSTQFI